MLRLPPRITTAELLRNAMPRWTPETRERQRQVINAVKPWEHSTGPRTPYGKTQSARNGRYHGPRAPGTHPDELRQQAQQWWRLLRLQRRMVRFGVGKSDDLNTICTMILAIEGALGIHQAETERRLARTLRAVD